MDTNGHTLGNAHGAIFPRSRDKDSGLPEEESPDVVGGQVPQFSQFPRAEMPLEYLRRVGSRFHHAITTIDYAAARVTVGAGAIRIGILARA